MADIIASSVTMGDGPNLTVRNVTLIAIIVTLTCDKVTAFIGLHVTMIAHQLLSPRTYVRAVNRSIHRHCNGLTIVHYLFAVVPVCSMSYSCPTRELTDLMPSRPLEAVAQAVGSRAWTRMSRTSDQPRSRVVRRAVRPGGRPAGEEDGVN